MQFTHSMEVSRGYTYKRFKNPDGSFTMQVHSGHIHYKDENGNFVESDFTPVDKGQYYEMSKHSYHLQVAKDFAAPLLMRFTNKLDGANHTITYEPFAIAWYNHQTQDVQIFRNQQSVQAEYRPDTNSFYYTNAFGNGVDFEITIQRSGFKKEVVIPNKPNQFPNPPGAGYRLVALFKYGGNGLNILRKKDGVEWDKSSHIDDDENGYEIQELRAETIEITDPEGNPITNNIQKVYKSFIRPAYAVDAEGRTKNLRVMWVRRNNQLWQVKEIPLNQMQNAKFPVRFDTSTSMYADSGDGRVYSFVSSNDWSVNHVPRDGTGATNGESLAYGLISDHRTIYNPDSTRSSNSFFSFDTSGIGTGSTVLSASFRITVAAVLNNVVTNYYLTNASQASTTTLVAADYDNFTQSAISTALATNGGTGNKTLTISDFSGIDTTGTTKFALVSEYLINDTTPATSGTGQSAIQHYYSEQTGTGSDPYLEITYAPADIKNSSLATNLVSYWKLEEASGTRVDSHGSNDLTGTTRGAVTGVIDNGNDFESGSGDYLTAGDTASLSITSDLSISCWVKYESYTTGQMNIVSKWRSTSGNRSYAFYTQSNNLYWLNSSTGNYQALAAVSWTPTTGVWYHLCVSYDASAGSATFYLDGSQLGSTQTGLPTSIIDNSTPFNLGAGEGSSPTLYFDGVMDEVAIWSRTLSASDAAALAQSIPYEAAAAYRFVPQLRPFAGL